MILSFLSSVLHKMEAKVSEKITILIGQELSKRLSKALLSLRKIRANPKITRSELVREILDCYTIQQEAPPKEDVYDMIIKGSIEYEKGGAEALAQGSQERAKKMFLLAAAREIEA